MVKLQHHPSTPSFQREIFTHGLEAWIPLFHHTFFFRLKLQQLLSPCSLGAKASGRKLSVHWQIHSASSRHMTCFHNSYSINRSFNQSVNKWAKVWFKLTELQCVQHLLEWHLSFADIKKAYPLPKNQFHRLNKWDISTFTLHHPGKSLSAHAPSVETSHRSFSPGS